MLGRPARARASPNSSTTHEGIRLSPCPFMIPGPVLARQGRLKGANPQARGPSPGPLGLTSYLLIITALAPRPVPPCPQGGQGGQPFGFLRPSSLPAFAPCTGPTHRVSINLTRSP